MSQFKIRRQRPIKGGRVYTFVALHPTDARLISDAARRFRVSKSFAASVFFADQSGNEEQETFLPVPKSGVRPKLMDELQHPKLTVVRRRA